MLGGYISDLEAGDIFEEVRYTLTPLIVSEYAHGVEDSSEWFQSPLNLLGRQARPPTMIHAEKMRLLDRNTPSEARISGKWHPDDARIHYEYWAKHHSVAYVGEELVLNGLIADRYIKRGRTYLHYQIEVRTAEGRLVTEYSDRTILRYRPDGGDDA